MFDGLLNFRLDWLDILFNKFNLLLVVNSVIDWDIFNPLLFVVVEMKVLFAIRIQKIVLMPILVF
jgi:hypothetical protein